MALLKTSVNAASSYGAGYQTTTANKQEDAVASTTNQLAKEGIGSHDPSSARSLLGRVVDGAVGKLSELVGAVKEVIKSVFNRTESTPATESTYSTEAISKLSLEDQLQVSEAHSINFGPHARTMDFQAALRKFDYCPEAQAVIVKKFGENIVKNPFRVGQIEEVKVTAPKVSKQLHALYKVYAKSVNVKDYPAINDFSRDLKLLKHHKEAQQILLDKYLELGLNHSYYFSASWISALLKAAPDLEDKILNMCHSFIDAVVAAPSAPIDFYQTASKLAPHCQYKVDETENALATQNKAIDDRAKAEAQAKTSHSRSSHRSGLEKILGPSTYRLENRQ